MRFWLALHDIAEWCHLPRRAQIWILMRAAQDVDYDLIEPDTGKEPF